MAIPTTTELLDELTHFAGELRDLADTVRPAHEAEAAELDELAEDVLHRITKLDRNPDDLASPDDAGRCIAFAERAEIISSGIGPSDAASPHAVAVGLKTWVFRYGPLAAIAGSFRFQDEK